MQAEEKQRAAQQFTKLQAAMKVLGVSGEEQKALWLILGAIYHLGAAGATKGGKTVAQLSPYRHGNSHVSIFMTPKTGNLLLFVAGNIPAFPSFRYFCAILNLLAVGMVELLQSELSSPWQHLHVSSQTDRWRDACGSVFHFPCEFVPE